tara:strand:- start:14381 stop:15289 length:909 start_codon:yes stop_codon:yes gene_type:complete
LDFVGKRIWYFSFSVIIVFIGIIFLIISPGLKPGIDFTGGSTLRLSFANDVTQGNIRTKLSELGHEGAIVQKMTSGEEGDYFIRVGELQLAEKQSLLSSLRESLSPDGINELSFDLVSPIVASETVLNAIYAVLAAVIGIFLYIWWAFRHMPSPVKYGFAAIIALTHDTLIVIGTFSMLGYLFDVEVNAMFLIALLTVVGYSVNDTIVVFDRVRENINLYPARSLRDNANAAIAESLGRSLNTSFTLLFTLLALMIFGGDTIKEFLWVLLIGVVVGTYSSLAIAAPVLFAWENKDFSKLFNR